MDFIQKKIKTLNASLIQKNSEVTAVCFCVI